jgi:hypothetical protein
MLYPHAHRIVELDAARLQSLIDSAYYLAPKLGVAQSKLA